MTGAYDDGTTTTFDWSDTSSSKDSSYTFVVTETNRMGTRTATGANMVIDWRIPVWTTASLGSTSYFKTDWTYYQKIQQLVFIDRLDSAGTATSIKVVFDTTDVDWAGGVAFGKTVFKTCVWGGTAKNHWDWMTYWADAAQSSCDTAGIGSCTSWTCTSTESTTASDTSTTITTSNSNYH